MGGCDRAIRLMMEKNEGLVVSKAKAYWEGIYATGMDKSLTQDDFIQLARIELWKAIAKFKPELGNKFSTYAGVCIDNKLKSVMRSVGSRYKQAGGKLVSLDRYAGTEDQLTYRMDPGIICGSFEIEHAITFALSLAVPSRPPEITLTLTM